MNIVPPNEKTHKLAVDNTLIDLHDIIQRLERLEDLERQHGDMMLFTVYSDDTGYLVAAPSVEIVMSMIPNQHTINFIGRANSMYTAYIIIEVWNR